MDIAIIGVPYSQDRREVGMGRAPAALLAAGLPDRLAALGAEVVSVETVTIPDSGAPREERIGDLLAALGRAVAVARERGALPLVLGGDCLTALGVLAGLGRPEETGIAWLDAHGDFNTPETTLSGYLGGMPLACAVGRGLDELRARVGLTPIPERNVALLGPRDLDPLEEHALVHSQVMLVRPIDLVGGAVLDDAVTALGDLPQLYLHIDIDLINPEDAPGVDFAAPDGPRAADVAVLAGRLAGLGNLAALALTAVNPEKDDGRTVKAALTVIVGAVGGAAGRGA